MHDVPIETTGWTPEDMIKIQSIGNIRVSPDGTKVVFTTRKAVITDDKSEYLTHIYLAATNNSEIVQLTSGEQSCTKPQWSPDGGSIAFTSNKSGKNALYLIDVNRGKTQQLIEVETNIESFKWSPDGQDIALVIPDPPSREEVKAQNKKTDVKIEEILQRNRLCLLPANTCAEPNVKLRSLTLGNIHVNHCFGGSSFDWSPDGRTIAFSHTPTPRVDDWVHGDISTIDIETEQITPLVHTRASERSPLYSPDGKWIVYQASDNPPTWFSTFDLYAVSSDGSHSHLLAETSERWSHIVGWSADSRKIYFTDTQGLVSNLYEVTLEGKRQHLTNIEDSLISSINMNQSRSSIGFTLQSSSQPPEVYVSSVQSFSSCQISQINSQAATRHLGRTQPIRYETSDGVEIDALLTYPIHYQEGTRYPLLLIIHGGPMGMFDHTFTAALNTDDPYPIAAFSSSGYAVLRCNVRGSSGYGKEFLRSNYRSWGGVDYEDLIHGVDYVIQMGVADSKRLGVMGWSYGGYLTAWIITQTNRFKAASVGSGAVNLISAIGTTTIPTCITDYFGAEIWEDWDTYRKHSPLFHVEKISTPTLLQYFEQDDIVPVTQGFEFYRALKKLNVPTQMVVYPRTPHGLQEPKLLLDFANRNLAWFDEHVKNQS